MQNTVFETPDWARDAVFYQILPDRFANATQRNDAKRSEAEPFGGEPSSGKREGGDLSGILHKLDYLHDLGVNALYLNPGAFLDSGNFRISQNEVTGLAANVTAIPLTPRLP